MVVNLLMIDNKFINQQIIVIGNMGKCRATFYIAQGKNAFYVRLQIIIHFNKSPIVNRYACDFYFQQICIGLSTSRQQNM